MAINFMPGDTIIPDAAFVDTLKKRRADLRLKQTLAQLTKLACEPLTVAATGILNTAPSRWFIRVVPVDTQSRSYRGGRGVQVLFASEDDLNNSFEFSKAFIKDKCIIKVLNLTGSTLSKNAIVYQSGYNTTQQLPTVALASAAVASTSIVFGAVATDIPDGECGNIINQGSIIVNTSGFSAEGDDVFLSDTPGALSTTAGTVSVVAGRVLCVATEGSITIFSGLTSGANTGGGGGGGGVPDTSTSFSIQTSDFNITSSDEYTIFTNDGAVQTVTGTIASGLPVNFEFHAWSSDAPEIFNIVPSGGETILSNNGETSAGITTLGNLTAAHAWLKKVTTTKWANLIGSWGNIVVEVEARAVEVTALQFDAGVGGLIQESTNWDVEVYTVDEPYDNTGPSTNTFLGSIDETFMYTQAGTSADLPMVVKFVNNDGGNSLSVMENVPMMFSGMITPDPIAAVFQTSQTLAAPSGFRWVWITSTDQIRDGGSSDPSGPNIAFADGPLL